MVQVDLTGMTEEELTQLRSEVDAEINRLRIINRAAAAAESVAVKYLSAVGREEGAEWVQPAGAHDSYPVGYIVTHNAKTWQSLVPGNSWEPGVSAWREVVAPGEPPAEFVAPSGAHDAYIKGSLVTFEGKVYESLIDANSWSPTEAPDLWQLVVTPPTEEETSNTAPVFIPPRSTTDAYDTGDRVFMAGTIYESLIDNNTWEPSPDSDKWSVVHPKASESPSEPEPDPVGEQPSPFVQPTGAHNAYNLGDQVTFNGKTYESVINGNSWSPTDYPAGWKVIV